MGTAVSRVGSLGVFACIGVAWPAAAQPVDIELVLAVDVSISVDGSELDLQRQGYADAFRAPDVIAAIAANAGGVAVSIVQWAGQGQQRTAVDWTLLTDADSSLRFAVTIDSALGVDPARARRRSAMPCTTA